MAARRDWISVCLFVLSSGALASLSGCGAMGTQGLQDLGAFFDSGVTEREEEQHREAWQHSRSPNELNWLLSNCIDAGMSPKEVSAVLGEQGDREYSDDWITNGGGHYQTGDETWKWGPDSEGRTVYLVFRDNKLVNYSPDEFKPSLADVKESDDDDL